MKRTGCLILFILLVIAAVYIFIKDPNGPPNFDKTTFVNIDTNIERGHLLVKLALNPDKTLSMSTEIVGEEHEGAQGTWQITREGNPVKLEIRFTTRSGGGHVDLYNNHEAVLGLENLELFGKWYQD